MKKRILSFIIVIAMLCSLHINALSATITTSGALYAAVALDASVLDEGTLTASVVTYNNTEPMRFTLGHYSKDNILLSCKSVVLEPTTPFAQGTVSLDIPSTVANGDYAKVVAMYTESMQTVALGGISKIHCQKPSADAEFVYDGMSERYYTISSPDGSLSVSKRVVSVAEEGTRFRLKDMAEGYVAFEDYTTPKYRLEYTAESGVRMWFYNAGGSKQRWVMEEYNDGYALLNANGGYLAIKDGAPIIQEEKYEWSIDYAGETPFSLMTSTAAFKLFTEAQQQRIIDICTSIGADALPFAANDKSFLDDCEDVFTRLYNNNDITDEEKKNQILSAVSKPVMGNHIVSPDFATPTFPGGDATITQSSPTKTKQVMWDLVEENGVIYSASAEHPYTGEAINCYRIDVTYKTASTTQTVKLYCVDPNFANVSNAITAFGKIPYEYRKNVKNMYVYLSTTDGTYNLGYNSAYLGDELFVRLTGTATVEAMVESFVHELGHSLDYHANGNPSNASSHWSQGSAWQTHIKNDIVTVSGYGNSNFYENFAEFARLYWLCYSNRDYQIGIAQLYPNTFASYKRALARIGVSPLY